MGEPLRFTKDHEWLYADGDVATVGITDFAQKELGDITYVEVPAVGKAVRKGDVLGVIESVKAASDVYAPVSGSIAETNPILKDKPETVNADPFHAGWICRIRMSDKSELSKLLTEDEYKAFVGGKDGT